MKIEKIIIANLSCSGCVNTITKSLSNLDYVKNVHVDLENHEVKVEAEDSLNRLNLTQELHRLGYPEATEENGLLTKIRSIKSCMIGKIS